MGISNRDFRTFYNSRTNDYIIANDYKYRRLIDRGYSKEDAEKQSHGHLKSKHKAEDIRDKILSNTRPKSRSLWILGCYIRVAHKDYRYYRYTKELYKAKKDKEKVKYINIKKGVR